jgi:CheY-specific phosphatase CheX
MNQSEWNRIDAMLADCAIALMNAFGTSVVHDPSGEAFHSLQDGVLAIIGFGGEQMRGSLVLSASRGLLAASRPVHAAGPATMLALQDWGGELANQLLGRLKLRLLAHHITIVLSTPTTVSGLELKVRNLAGELQSTALWFYAGTEWLVVRLDAMAAAHVVLTHAPESETDAPTTVGDMLLF